MKVIITISVYICLTALSALSACSAPQEVASEKEHNEVITPTGLTPVYPKEKTCSRIKSLYASMIDIDGLPRESMHAGIDTGKLGEPVLAPASGVVISAWVADWGWGEEGALLILHSDHDLNYKNGTPFYYSAFYHLKTDIVKNFKPGQKIHRGEKLAAIFRPGGEEKYLPEVHWETWAVSDNKTLEWKQSNTGHYYWTNTKARLVDPLALLGLHTEVNSKEVLITPYSSNSNYNDFIGFTYILPCR